MLDIVQKEIEDVLLEEGLITISQLKEAWSLNVSLNKPIIEIMLEQGIITQRDAVFAKAKLLEVEYRNLAGYQFEDINIHKLISKNIAKKHCAVPLEFEDNKLVIAMKDPKDLYALDDLALAANYPIKPVMSWEKDIEELIDTLYKPEKEIVEEVVFDEIQQIKDNPSSLDKSEIEKIIAVQNPDNSPIFKSKLGGLLVSTGILTRERLEEALKIQQEKGGKIGSILVNENFISEDVMYKFLEVQLNVPYIDLKNVEISQEAAHLVKETLARKYNLIPVEIQGDILKVAMSDPTDVFALDDLRLATGMEIHPMLANEYSILQKLDSIYMVKDETEHLDSNDNMQVSGTSSNFENFDLDEEIRKVNEEIAVEIELEQKDEDISDLSEISNAPIVKMVNFILQKAIAQRASDIHIEPYADIIMIRFRIDGQLTEVMKYDKKILSSLVARIKIISSLNIAEKRIPQDGRITIAINNRNYDMRVSVLPTVHGEKVVIRIADKDSFNVSKKDLGLFEDDMEKFDEILSNPHGIVLVTGPTGSGKSTTLYTALRELSKPNVNILTVEDPVECTIRGINQVQVNTKAGLTFGSALRAFLRQDPDIIMVGEIRDGETAEIATRAAITGHLVLSTLHTNDAASSITRMIDMGIEPFIISSSIVGVIAQRLVRRLCPFCRQEYIPQDTERSILKLDETENIIIYRPAGCSACNYSGYKGRIAVYEIMNITRKHRDLIAKNVSADTLKELSISLGMRTLRDSCIRLVKDGTTTLDELLRVTYGRD